MSLATPLPTARSGTASPEIRLRGYNRAINREFVRKRAPRAHYLIANLALEKLIICASNGQEPSTEEVKEVEHGFDKAARINKGVDQFNYFRARLLKVWIRPVIWADVINLDTLTDKEACNATEATALGESADATAELVAEALKSIDELDAINREQITEEEARHMQKTSGFLHEATPLLLGSRSSSAMLFAVPSLAYDDYIEPNKSLHVDGYVYDNRVTRGLPGRFPYQSEGTTARHNHIASSIPVVSGLHLGNKAKTSHWPNDNRTFATTRRLVTERRGKKLSEACVATLDQIASETLGKIIGHNQ